jgi:hypothetical protein
MLLVARVHAVAAVMWIASALAGAMAYFTGSALAFMTAGVALGFGFVVASETQTRLPRRGGKGAAA